MEQIPKRQLLWFRDDSVFTYRNTNEKITLVINPANVRDILLTAPISGDNSIALLVPIT